MVKRVFIQISRLIPLILLERLGQLKTSPNARRLARWGLKNRDVILKHGVGAGLKFNAGDSNPDGAIGTYEMPVQQALFSYLKSGDTFYDIGANVGFFSIIGAKLVGASGHVYAFEPAPENAASIRRNAQLNNFSHLTVLEKAVSRSTGQGELLLGDYCGGHTLSTAGSRSEAKNAIAVDIVSIDDLVEQQKLPSPTVVKIDVEGAEINVLQGMPQTIKEFKPVIIYEIDDRSKKSFQRKQEEVDSFMCAFEYEIMPLEDSYSEIGWNVRHVIATPN